MIDIFGISWQITFPWASYQIRKIASGACARNACWERFPRHRLQRKPQVSDPRMHQGTCVMHMPWCMSGLLTRGGGENVPSISNPCTTLCVSGKRPIKAAGTLWWWVNTGTSNQAISLYLNQCWPSSIIHVPSTRATNHKICYDFSIKPTHLSHSR